MVPQKVNYCNKEPKQREVPPNRNEEKFAQGDGKFFPIIFARYLPQGNVL